VVRNFSAGPCDVLLKLGFRTTHNYMYRNDHGQITNPDCNIKKALKMIEGSTQGILK